MTRSLTEYRGGNARIIAGPGTGKTTWIVRRAKELVSDRGVDPQHILILTFSVATAHDLRKRLAEEGAPPEVKVATLHAYCYQQLRQYTQEAFVGATMMDDWEERQLLCEDIGQRLGITGAAASKWLDAYDAAWRTLDEPPEAAKAANFEAVLEDLRQVFGFALLGESVYKFKRFMDGDAHFAPEVRHLLVDEYQDLNACDLAVINQIFSRSGAETVVVGDDDQCIYSFRHALPEGLARFEDEYPDAGSFEADVSYRCPEETLEPAKRLIARNDNRLEKRLAPARGGGTFRVIGCRSPQEQAETVCRIIEDERRRDGELNYDNVLVLVPNPKVVPGYLEAFDQRGIPALNLAATDVSLKGPAVRKVLYLFRLAVNGNDQIAMRGWLHCSDGVGPGTVEKIIALARETRCTFAEATRAIQLAKVKSAVQALDEAIVFVNQDGGARTVLDELEQEVPLIGEAKATLELAAAQILSEEIQEGFSEHDEGELLQQQAEEAMAEEESHGRVRILTFRKAKGLGEPVVIVTDVEEAFIPGSHTDNIPEQRRLVYVALTRSKRSLYATHVAGRRWSGSERFAGAGAANPDAYRQRSRFLDEAGVPSESY